MRGKFPAHVKKNVVLATPITAGDVGSIGVFLPLDANDSFYCACVSVMDGLRGIDAEFYTWSTVKFYYSVYYSIQSILAWNGIVVFRPEKAPFRVRATVGEYPIFLEGQGSHKPMLDCFRQLKPTHQILSQDIDLVDGPQWMMEKRESANYHASRFCEPTVPEHYEKIADLGVRKAIVAYLDSDALAFDKDHAIVSFPIMVLKCASDVAKANGGAEIDDDEMEFLRKKSRERNSALAPMLTFVAGTRKK
jgi:hypothetical protein